MVATLKKNYVLFCSCCCQDEQVNPGRQTFSLAWLPHTNLCINHIGVELIFFFQFNCQRPYSLQLQEDIENWLV